MGRKDVMTEAHLIAELRKDVADWHVRRKAANRILVLCVFTAFVSACHLVNPMMISPYQHLLTGLLLGMSRLPERLWDRDIRSLWLLQSLDLGKAAMDRANPFSKADAEFVHAFRTTAAQIRPMRRASYGPHLVACLHSLETVTPAVRPLLAAHVALMAHAVPRKTWWNRA